MNETAYLIVDCESVPDGQLIADVKYPGEGLSPEAAVDRYRSEAREASWNGSDFLPYTFQYPVAVCVVRVRKDYSLEAFTCLDAPQYRPAEIARQFWKGYDHYKQAKLVTFNGRGFDVPLLELAAYKLGIPMAHHLTRTRHRYNGGFDLQEFFTNFGASRFTGGLNLAAKLLGLPGKMDVKGDEVLELHRAGQLQAINDYCLCDTLDTYFVFLRIQVLSEELTLADEKERIKQAREYLETRADDLPALRKYLDSWK
jgi:predicted PolB exonuclease-like 3'-5' exonuclease